MTGDTWESITGGLATPVVVPEFNMSSWLQHLAILQPGELRQRLALSQAGEDGRGAHRACDGLRRLDELGWS